MGQFQIPSVMGETDASVTSPLKLMPPNHIVLEKVRFFKQMILSRAYKYSIILNI